MTELLDLALAAHGGLDQWDKLGQLRVDCSVGGVTWPSDGVFAQTVATLDTRSQRVSYDPIGSVGRRSVYTPDRVEIRGADGTLITERDQPRRAFKGHGKASSWDQQHKAYFASYALWNYLNLPFLLARGGFTVKEMEPWRENGQTWRRLRAEFPDGIVTHAPVQTFYFGSDHLLRRHDYDAELLGGQPTAHYSSDYKTFDGFAFATRRRVVPRNPDNTAAEGPVLVSIDIQSVSVS